MVARRVATEGGANSVVKGPDRLRGGIRRDRYLGVRSERALLRDILEIERPDEASAYWTGMQLLNLYRRCLVEVWNDGRRVDVLPPPPKEHMH